MHRTVTVEALRLFSTELDQSEATRTRMATRLSSIRGSGGWGGIAGLIMAVGSFAQPAFGHIGLLCSAKPAIVEMTELAGSLKRAPAGEVAVEIGAAMLEMEPRLEEIARGRMADDSSAPVLTLRFVATYRNLLLVLRTEGTHSARAYLDRAEVRRLFDVLPTVLAQIDCELGSSGEQISSSGRALDSAPHHDPGELATAGGDPGAVPEKRSSHSPELQWVAPGDAEWSPMAAVSLLILLIALPAGLIWLSDRL